MRAQRYRVVETTQQKKARQTKILMKKVCWRVTFLFTFVAGVLSYLVHATFVSRRELGKREQYKSTRVKTQLNGQCPFAIQKNVGLFDKSKSNSVVMDDFPEVILLVACNFAYYDMLQNWEYLANDLGLKWAVLALDHSLYKKLGPDRSISPGDASVPGPQRFRKGRFNKLSCNKLRFVMEVAENCKVDIVFSDADNIFYKNPFEHDLGRLIKSKRYDYIYQSNYAPTGTKPGTDRCLHGFPRTEANTGFYYFSRESIVLKRIYESTLERCDDPKNELDDQSLFWEEFWKTASKETDITFNHCEYDEYLEPTKHDLEQHQSNSSFDFCCLDPYYYPIGQHNPNTGPLNKDPVTYHANYVQGYRAKVQKLANSRWDRHGWDDSRITDGHGGVLGKRLT